MDLDISARGEDAAPEGGIPVASRVWLVIKPTATVGVDEMPHLLKGIRRVAERVRAATAAPSQQLVFSLDHLWYPPTDFQDDALDLAIAAWAVEELGLVDEPAKVSFDRRRNRYLIEFNEALWEAPT